ncbi:MAG: SGNH/GDSL hydrolase family protein [Clostridia bacterium]|nr:SGNH/GDSL hydrolase family protein [Clostridia bacterium]
MFLAEEDLTLHITRGDAGEITVRAIDEKNDGTEAPYVFKAGEVLRLKVYEKKNCSKVVLQKDFGVVENTEMVTLALTEADTKIGDTISKPVDYWYEIELNPFTEPQTIVGYDDDGAKILRLYPEGLDTEYIPPTEEELGTVDKELDLTSERAIQNQAVARAIVQLESTVEKNNTTATEGLAKVKEDAVMLEARVNNLATIEEGSTTGDAELIDARVGYDGTVYDNLGTAIRTQATDIAPPRMHLSGDAWKGTEVETIFTANSYYRITSNSVGVAPYLVEAGKWGMQEFSCIEGEKYLLYIGANIGGNHRDYFVPVDENGLSTVARDDLPNYLTLYDGTNWVYLATIPKGTKKVYTLSTTADRKVEKAYETYNIEWLKLKESNFIDKCVPLSALQDKVEYKYGNCVAKPLNYGSTLLTFGDSITQRPNSYAGLFATAKGLTLTNRASSGATIVQEAQCPYGNIHDRVLETTTQADTIIVAGGSNDYWYQEPLGEFDSTDPLTFYGALRGICEYLQTNYANANVIFITPINRTSPCNKSAIPETGEIPLNAYRNAIFEIATVYGYNVVNGLDLNFPNETGAYHDYMFEDGLHPTTNGYKVYANSLMGILG